MTTRAQCASLSSVHRNRDFPGRSEPFSPDVKYSTVYLVMRVGIHPPIRAVKVAHYPHCAFCAGPTSYKPITEVFAAVLSVPQKRDIEEAIQ